MKTRILSFLLLLAMLVSMVPTFAVSGSETTGDGLPKSETSTPVKDGYDIYVTDGLVAFFDALDANDATLDLANGTWYAKVYDQSSRTFVPSNTYVATITGGAYDAETNPTGWKPGADGHGFGFDDPDFVVADNRINFGTVIKNGDADQAIDLLSTSIGARYFPLDEWTVDTLLQVNLRKNPMQYDVYVENGTGDKHPLTKATEGDMTVYTAMREDSTSYDPAQAATVVISGTPDASVTLKLVSNNNAADGGSEKTVTLDAEGKATFSYSYKGKYVKVAVPAGVVVESVKLPFSTAKASASVPEGFYLGTLSALFYTGKYGFSGGGDGYGDARWIIANGNWSNRGATQGKDWQMVTAPSAASIWENDKGFLADDGKIVPLYVTKKTVQGDGKEVTYDVLHGSSHRVGTLKNYTYSDAKLQILANAQGYVYTFRVYNRALNEAERARNAAADRIIRLGVDIDLFNEMNDATKNTFYTTLAELPADATKDDVEQLIRDTIEYAKNLGAAKQLSEYDKLYVGYDGEGGFTKETANGGKLTSLFTAYAGDVSANLSQGVWINKLENADAKLGNKRFWQKYDEGGIGVTQLYGSYIDDVFSDESEYTTLTTVGTRLEFDLSLLPTADYSIEYVAQYRNIMAADENGHPVIGVFDAGGQTPGSSQYGVNRYTPVDWIGNLTSWSLKRDGTGGDGSFWGANGTALFAMLVGEVNLDGTNLWNTSAAFEGRESLFDKQDIFYTRNKMLTFEIARDAVDDTTATYFFYRNASQYHRAYTDETFEYDLEHDKDNRMFYLAERLSVDFYAVRIYDAQLTAAEKEQNHFADLMAYGQVNLTSYNALNDNEKKIIRGWLASQPFTSDTEALTETVETLIKSLKTSAVSSDSLYVTDGLRVLTTAYNSFNTGSFRNSDSAISWFNGAPMGGAVSVNGNGWQLQVDGGFKIKRTYAEWQADKDFGLYLTPDMLPDSDYTVEMITNPSGLTVDNPDGTVSRYLDDHSAWGTYNMHGISIGPLRCINFVCDCLKSPQSGMERRWVYRIANLCWSGNGHGDGDGDGPDSTSVRATDKSWMQVDVDDIINYRITMSYDQNDGSTSYMMYTDNKLASSFGVKAKGHITNAQANNMFQLMVGMPNTIYAIRVYDRVLTENEISQNHAADIIYFYGLDVELFKTTMELFPEDPMLLYRMLDQMDFSLDKETAKQEFEARLAAMWLEFTHTGVRNDKNEGMRFYFDFNLSNAENVVEKGYKIEIGMLANIGSGIAPTLAGNNYDYKVVVYDSTAGKIKGFFVDEDTVALTVLAESANKEAMLAGINVCGYIKMIDENGEETLYYATTSALTYEFENLFSAYTHMAGLDKLKNNGDLLNYYQSTVDSCYVDKYVYLDASAAAGGNGSKDHPYNAFSGAFVASLEQLKLINRPTRFYLEVADGEYLISDEMVMTAEDNPYYYCEFIITSANNNTRLTSARTVDSSGFTLQGDNVYIYQFAADENGNYPEFRYLYVNNALAQMAYNGSQYIEDHSQPRYLTSFNRYDDGPYILCQQMAKEGTLTSDSNPYPKDKVVLGTRFVYYREQFLAIQELADLSERSLDAEGRYTLSLDAQTEVEKPSPIYEEAFQKYLLYYVARNEIANLYHIDLLPRSLFYNRETSIADASEEYKKKFKELANRIASTNLQPSDLVPTVENVVTVESSKGTMQVPEGFPSGMLDRVKAELEAGTLSYTSRLANETMYEGVVWGMQYDYYRDALLALRDVLAQGDQLAVDTAANEAGSDQYKKLFDAYKYEILAMAELKMLAEELQENRETATAWRALFITAESKKTDPPAEYLAIFTEMREKVVLDNYKLLDTYQPEVLEADAPYEGLVPIYDPRVDAKLYVQKDLVGDLTRAMTDGAASLPSTSADWLAKAKAVYDAAYAELVAAEQLLADLEAEIVTLKATIAATKDTAVLKVLKNKLKTLEVERLAASNMLPVTRKSTVAAKATYENAIAEALLLVDPETTDRYSLMSSGLEMQLVVEWSFDIMPIWGIDYDDTITKEIYKRDETGTLVTQGGQYVVEGSQDFVAIYLNKDIYQGMAIGTRETYYYPGDTSSTMGRMTWLVGSDKYLDYENEYYYDQVSGKLYYYTATGVSDKVFAYPQLDNMFCLNDVSNVTFSGLEITGMDDMMTSENGFLGGQAGGYKHLDVFGNETGFPSRAPIYGFGGDRITITNCDFHDLPCEGVSLHGRLDNTEIAGNSFVNIGATAVRVGTSPAHNTVMSEDYGAVNVKIDNNYIDYTGVVFRNCPAVTVPCSADLSIQHNTILHSAYSAISIGWCWDVAKVPYSDPEVKTERAEIAYNYIMHFMTEMGDGGAIYALGGNAYLDEHTLFNKLHDNYIVFSNISGDGEKHFYAGIYYDGAASNWDTYSNVVVSQSYGAVESENKLDGDPANAEYLRRLRNRYNQAAHFFAQNIKDLDSMNVLFRDNYFVGSRATEGNGMSLQEARIKEAYAQYLRAEYRIFEENTHFVKNPGMMPVGAEAIAYASGCDSHHGNPTLLYGNDY